MVRWLLLSFILIASNPVAARDCPLAETPDYRLDFDSNVLNIPVAGLVKSENNRFVFVNVSAVVNPQVLPLSFSVSFFDNDKKIMLGGFALFPGDNPGQFIVSTQGIVDKTGSILIEMDSLAEYKGTDKVHVEISNVKLVDALVDRQNSISNSGSSRRD